jgi:molecular chaperone GrpE
MGFHSSWAMTATAEGAEPEVEVVEEAAKEVSEDADEEPDDMAEDEEEGTPEPTEVQKLEKALAEAIEAKTEAEKKVLYALAEAETVRRRSKTQIEDAKQFGVEKFARDILEVADNMGRGLAWVPKEVADGPSGEENPNPDLKSLYGGMRSTETIMLNILQRNGIERVEPLGEIYDPATSRAIAQVPDPEKEPGTVLEVTAPGYILNGRVLRAADVVVVQEQ